MSKPFFETRLAALAKDVGAGPDKRVILLLDDAGWNTLPNLVIPEGWRLACLPPYSPDLQPAETPWTLADGPVVNRHVDTVADVQAVVTERCVHLTGQADAIESRTAFSRWPRQPRTSRSRGPRGAPGDRRGADGASPLR